MTQAIQKSTAPAIRILKAGICPSVSGKSKLTYHFGCDADSQVFLRVHANSSSGYFSREWIGMAAIQQVFANVPADKGITSFLLHSLFEGKSQNNAGFLFAVLVAEGLVQPSPDKQRSYQCTDGKQFAAEVSALIASGASLKVDEPVAKPAGKIKGKAAIVEPTPETPVTTPAPSVSGKKAKATPKVSPKKT